MHMNFDSKHAHLCTRRSLIRMRRELCHGKGNRLLPLLENLKIIQSNLIVELLYFIDEETGPQSAELGERGCPG